MTVITEELKNHVGAELPPFEFEISRGDLKKYAVATGQRLERYLNGDEAPLLYLFAAMMPVVPLDRLLPDGRQPDSGLMPPLPLNRVMAGGSEYQVHRKVYAGDVLVCRQKFVEVFEKTGAEGPLLFLVFENRFETRDGEPVVTERLTRIAR
ncbi:FAS1-like dehydratase domain-containing protein [Alloalcanivorax xenomutans]|uniref:FAS1-like dehydratase domain-containing protein n=1 Tax=Alloalcanivorax xenomutans TaxID=1094342 RepID=UPI0006D7777A|nr:MaoC family dehydratase N-terminal domain-containing protein [Alloalcanivorax xenomutans]PHS71256.1 MAG: acyl dehydratase [Alcanivorax sp.]